MSEAIQVMIERCLFLILTSYFLPVGDRNPSGGMSDGN
jgi:hypothetical protein